MSETASINIIFAFFQRWGFHYCKSHRSSSSSASSQSLRKFIPLWPHRQPKLCGSSLDFEFIRECMKINKIRPKFHFSTKNRNKNDLPCVCVCYILSLRLQSHLEAVLSTFKILNHNLSLSQPIIIEQRLGPLCNRRGKYVGKYLQA